MNKFRPQDINKRYTISLRRKSYESSFASYNWQTRVKWYPAGYKLNRRTISNQFSRLHYLGSHSPTPIQKKWQRAAKQFERRHFGDHRRASMRYLNTWSAHSWL
jgi:hypothetical protein